MTANLFESWMKQCIKPQVWLYCAIEFIPKYSHSIFAYCVFVFESTEFLGQNNLPPKVEKHSNGNNLLSYDEKFDQEDDSDEHGFDALNTSYQYPLQNHNESHALAIIRISRDDGLR